MKAKCIKNINKMNDLIDGLTIGKIYEVHLELISAL